MSTSPRRLAATAAAATAMAALLAGAAGCAPADQAVDHTVKAETAGQDTVDADSTPATSGVRGPDRNRDEQEFLDDLAAFGLPTGMTSATTVEVGIGICRNIADGADTETILERIRPLTSAMAAQDPDRDTSEIGRAIIDASQAHLCD